VDVSFEMRAPRLPAPAARLRREIAEAARAAGFEGSLSVAVVGDATMRRVNRDFHACDAPTDVLAFPLGTAAAKGGGFDAEVVVSMDTARREAAARGVTPLAELMLYVVHGVLHLMGHDETLAILAALGHRNTIRAASKPPRPGRSKRSTT
jgi:probable rRNA maturation factor